MQSQCHPLHCHETIDHDTSLIERQRAMGKTGRWLRSFLGSSGGKKDKEKNREKEKNANPSSPLPAETRSAPVSVSTPKEKRRWSFRRSIGIGKDLNSPDLLASVPIHGLSESSIDQKRHTVAVAEATAAAKDAAMAGAQAAAAVVIRLTMAGVSKTGAVEDAAATKIQAALRSYLARKALFALRGLVKLQALVRGHLVRRQATATLRCMQALVAVQARACAQRIQMLEESQSVSSSSRQTPVKRSPHHSRFRQSFDVDRSMEENVKTVEMDLGETRGCSRSRNSYSITQYDRTDHRYGASGGSYQQFSPAPSNLTDISPRGCSGRFEDFSFATAQSSPHYFSPTSKDQLIVSQQDESTYSASSEYPFFPSYMANTESSRAKSRSQSAPKQRPDSYERQPSRRRPSVEGRNIPRSVRMQRSSSHVGASVNGRQYPWQFKLDRSNMSLKDSECGSTSTVVSNANYCRSIASSMVGIH